VGKSSWRCVFLLLSAGLINLTIATGAQSGGSSLLGGEGTVLGAILGAAIMGVMVNGMVVLNLSSYVQDIILGAVLVIAVVYDTIRRGGRFEFWKKWFSSQA